MRNEWSRWNYCFVLVLWARRKNIRPEVYVVGTSSTVCSVGRICGWVSSVAVQHFNRKLHLRVCLHLQHPPVEPWAMLTRETNDLWHSCYAGGKGGSKQPPARNWHLGQNHVSLLFFWHTSTSFQLLDKPWSQESFLLPLGSCLQFLSRI